MKKVLRAIILILIVPVSVWAYSSPGKAAGFVNDFASVLTPESRVSMETKIASLQKSSGIEIAVVTVRSLGNDTVENYAVKLFEDWKIGNAEKDNGLLVLVAPNDRKARIEIGYGLEGVITDLQANKIMQNVMIPAFKDNDYSRGTEGAVDAIIGIINGTEGALEYASSSKGEGFKIPLNEFTFFLGFVILQLMFHLLAKTKSWWLGGVIGAIIGTIVGFVWGFLYTGFVTTVTLIILGLIVDFVASKHGDKVGRFFTMIGGGMGGGRNGGSGFGGFGGGSSGGGGASGSW